MKKSVIFGSASIVCAILTSICTFTTIAFYFWWSPFFFGILGVILGIVAIVLATKEPLSKVLGIVGVTISAGITTLYLIQLINLIMAFSELGAE